MRRGPRESKKVHEVCDQHLPLSPAGFTARVPKAPEPPRADGIPSEINVL